MSEIVTYIRNRKNEPIGTLLAYKNEDNKIHIGFSLCKPRKKKILENGKIIFEGDTFSKEFGKEIAKSRAKNWAGFDGITIVGNKNCKYSSKKDYHEDLRKIIEKKKDQTLPPRTVVPIDGSITKNLCKFIHRCDVYFKDSPLPLWAKGMYEQFCS